MRFTNAVLLAGLLILSSSGCSSVSSTQPLGAPVAADDAKKLAGVWLSAEDVPMEVRHVKDNELRIGWIEWKDGSFKLKQFTAFITADEGQKYANIVEPDSPADAPKFRFFRLKWPDEEFLLVNLPNVDAFEKAVIEKRLAGTVKKERHGRDVLLNPSKAQLDEFVDPEKMADQFELDPEVLRRIRKFEEDK